jgi:hypothetical protein
VGEIRHLEEAVDLARLGDLRVQVDRRIGRRARLEPQYVEIRAVVEPDERDAPRRAGTEPGSPGTTRGDTVSLI